MVETFKSPFEGRSQNVLDAQAQEAKVELADMEIDGRMKLAQHLMRLLMRLQQ